MAWHAKAGGAMCSFTVPSQSRDRQCVYGAGQDMHTPTALGTVGNGCKELDVGGWLKEVGEERLVQDMVGGDG